MLQKITQNTKYNHTFLLNVVIQERHQHNQCQHKQSQHNQGQQWQLNDNDDNDIENQSAYTKTWNNEKNGTRFAQGHWISMTEFV